MRRGLIAVFVLALAVGLALWLARRAHLGPSGASLHPAARPHAAATRTAAPTVPLRLPTARTQPAAAAPATAGFGGRVLSTTTSEPVARASLTFLHAGAAISTESGADGRFTVAATGYGAYELTSATATGYAPFEAELGHSPVVISTRPGVRVDEVTIFLTPSMRLTVAVTDEAGKPLPGAEVRAVGDRAAEAAAVTTDAKGEAQLTVEPFAEVEARKPGYRRARATVNIGAQARHRLVLALDAGAEPARLPIAGRVVDGRGAAVDGALVEAWSLVPGEPPLAGQSLSGLDGRFVIDDLAAGSYRVRATARGQGSAELRDVDAGARDVELRLGAPDAGIRGRVTDDQGAPLPAFTVVATPREGVLGRGPELRASVVDPDGRYQLPLPPGSYVVAAAARGFARSADRGVEVVNAPVEVDFTLDHGSGLYGRVVERDGGAAIAGAIVTVESDRLADGITMIDDVVTGGDGAFRFDGLRAGRTSLDVQAPAHDGRILGGLEVPQKGALGPIVVDLGRVKPGAEPKTEFVGIAATLSAEAAGLVVKNVLPGGGAADAGLVPGDLILAIDGQPVSEFGNAIQLIRGPEGTVVVLTIRHADGSTSVVPVTRKRVNF